MSRTQRVDPNETGKFTRPQIKKMDLSRLKQFGRVASARVPNILEEHPGSNGSLEIRIGEIPGAKKLLQKAMYASALEVALNKRAFSKKDEANAVNAARKWKNGEFIGTRRMRALVKGKAAPTLEELRAVYSALGEKTNTINSLAYLLRILHNTANPTQFDHKARAEDSAVVQAAKECLSILEKRYATLA